MSRVASVYLSKDERDRFMRVCEKEGCTPYALAKKALLEHIWNYPLEEGSAPEKDTEGRETEGPTPEVSVEEASEKHMKEVRDVEEGFESGRDEEDPEWFEELKRRLARPAE